MPNSHALKLFVVLCRTFATVSGAAKRDIKNHGLSLSAFETLELLYHKGEQTIQEVGKKVLLTSGSMTYVVDQLEKKKLVTRNVCEADRRVTYVALTDGGTALMEDVFPQHRQRIGELFSSLTNEEMVSLTEALKKISKSITEESEPSC